MCRIFRLLLAFLAAMNIAAAAADPPVKQLELRINITDLAPPRVVPVHLWMPAQPALKPRPLLLFFPGWGEDVDGNASLLGSLAARGFIVAGVAYPEGSGLPDPKIPMQFTSDAAFAAGRAQGNRMVEIQAEDASRVLDTLLAPQSPLVHANEHADPKMIGVLGYSLGGAVAAQTALRDPRVRAAMNLDGWMFGDVVKEQFSRPYLVISDGLPPATEAEMTSPNAFLSHFARLRHSDRIVQDAQLRHSGGWRVTIAGSDHFTFADKAVKGQPGTGTIDPPLAREIVAAYAADFFTKILEGQSAPLLEGHSRYPEARVEHF